MATPSSSAAPKVCWKRLLDCNELQLDAPPVRANVAPAAQAERDVRGKSKAVDCDESEQLPKQLQRNAVRADCTVIVSEEGGVSQKSKFGHATEIPEHSMAQESVQLPQQVRFALDSHDVPDDFLPVIDLAADHEDLVRDVGKACECGFFQIINHGICPELIAKIGVEANEFFSLPVEEKSRCSTPDDVPGKMPLGGGSKAQETDDEPAVEVDYWPVRAVDFRKTLLEYVEENKVLVKRLLRIISESLGLDTDYIENDCGEEAVVLMAITHSPACPDDHTHIMSTSEQSDPNTITILLEDHVAGLQMYRDGNWFEMKSLENALIVNAGDHLQILSNGKYPSCLHRVVSNKLSPRISVALSYSPSHSAHIMPAPALVSNENPAQYFDFFYGEFLKNVYPKTRDRSRKVVLGQFQTEMGDD